MNIAAIGTVVGIAVIAGYFISVILDDPYKPGKKSDGTFGGAGGVDGSDVSGCGGDAGGCD